ncbi:MAG TPA: hypothetical protein VFZ34_11810, partial [Blastocatellia bacterium]|nr:hypothetical protein [Blastocatellia bacterium]
PFQPTWSLVLNWSCETIKYRAEDFWYRSFITWFIVCALLVVPGFAQTNNKQLEKETKLKQKIVEWGTNKNVSVKLKSGEKIDGRIAEIKDEVFVVQLVDKDKVTSRDMRYSDVNKISEKDGGKAGRIAGYTALGVLAGIGATFLVIWAVLANS